MTTLIEQMTGLADDLTERCDIRAFADPRAAGGYGKPCLLVTPPTTSYTTLTRTWTIVALSGTTSTDLTATQLLADMVDVVAARVPIEDARPGLYQLGPELPTWAAYLMTLTGGIPS